MYKRQGEGECEFGGELPGDLAVDGVEGGLGGSSVAAGESRQALDPDGPPLPGVFVQKGVGGRVDDSGVAAIERCPCLLYTSRCV